MSIGPRLLLIASTFILFSGCGASADGWSGAENGLAVTQLAERDCECMAEYYQAIGIDVQLLLEHHPALMAASYPTDEKSLRDMNPELPLQLSKLRGAFLQWQWAPTCQRSVLDELEGQHLNFESIAPILGQHCALYQLSTTF